MVQNNDCSTRAIPTAPDKAAKFVKVVPAEMEAMRLEVHGACDR